MSGSTPRHAARWRQLAFIPVHFRHLVDPWRRGAATRSSYRGIGRRRRQYHTPGGAPSEDLIMSDCNETVNDSRPVRTTLSETACLPFHHSSAGQALALTGKFSPAPFLSPQHEDLRGDRRNGPGKKARIPGETWPADAPGRRSLSRLRALAGGRLGGIHAPQSS